MRYDPLENTRRRPFEQVKEILKQDIMMELPFGSFLLHRTRQNFYFGSKHLVQMVFSSWLMIKISMPEMLEDEEGKDRSSADHLIHSSALIAEMTGVMWLGMVAAGWGCNLLKRGGAALSHCLGFFQATDPSATQQITREMDSAMSYQANA